jgi:pyrroloquinoline quinone biosynthesis protein B
MPTRIPCCPKIWDEGASVRARVVVLGTAQDGGVPHAGCTCPTCAHARRDPAHRRRVASIGIVGVTGRRLLVDATPDLPAQIARLAEVVDAHDHVPDAVLLTHAHVGHVLGLAWFGREAMSVRGLPLLGTASMAAYLRANRPWAHLLDRGEVVLEIVRPGVSFDFDGVAVTPFLSPHRSEDTDTLGLHVRGDRRTVVYVPDADRFDDALVARIVAADDALVDGTFHDAGELEGRPLDDVPHPLVCESVERLAGARGRVWFTHLNHTNALLADEPPRLPPPFAVLDDDAAFPLGPA